MNSGTSRLVGALILSMVTHFLIIMPLRLPTNNKAEALQLHLRASVTRTPPAEVPPKETSAPPKIKAPAPQAQRLTAPKGAKHAVLPAPPKKPPQPPAAEENAAEPADALVLDQALLPEYPADALAQGLEGCVLASVQVSNAGEVDSVSIVATDHPGVFDQAVIDAQKSARYVPARRGGEGVSSRVLAVATFVIQPGKQLDCPLKFAPQAEKIVQGSAP